MKSIKFISAAIAVILLISFFAKTAAAQVRHVVLISIDGLHPDMYLDKSWPAENLRQLAKNGTNADHLLSVFPSYTYPSHAAMLTGALPARSKVTYNQPVNDHSGAWNWYAKYTQVPTIWRALHQAGMRTAAVYWPGTVGNPDITYNLSEIWDNAHPDDRATAVRQHASPTGLFEEVEEHATGKLDSVNMNDNHFSLDENAGRIAAYILTKYHPSFLALHFATVDGEEHEFGRDADSVRLALEANDRAIGAVLQAIHTSKLDDSTTVIIVGDHGFANINQIMRPNMLIRNVKAKFTAAGGSCFLYRNPGTRQTDESEIVKAVSDSLNQLPAAKRALFRIIGREELDQMGADSAALLALTGVNGSGLVFSGATAGRNTENHGPGTLIQNNKLAGVFVPSKGGHHGYDPNNPEMYTGFIAYGAGIIKGGHVDHLSEPDIAVLISVLLNIHFETPDGHYVSGILNVNSYGR